MGGYGQGEASGLGERRPTRPLKVGAVQVGGGAPISVQSMTTTDTADAAATLAQIRALAEAGADIVRLAVPGDEAAAALPAIVKATPGPAGRRHPLRLPAGAEGARRRHARPSGSTRATSARATGSARWSRRPESAPRPHPHRRQRRLAGAGHRGEARLAHRRGDGGERRAPHPLPGGRGLPGDQGLAEGPRRRHDGGGQPALLAGASTTRSTSASPRPARSSPAR